MRRHSRATRPAGGCACAVLALASASFGQAPANDECTGALPIALNDLAVFDTTNATGSPQPVNQAQCAGTFLGWGDANKDVWFKWVATDSINIIATTCDPNSFDTSMVIYEGTDCGALVQVTCNGDASQANECQEYYSQVTNLFVTAGRTYYFRVGGYTPASGISASGSGSLLIHEGYRHECVVPAFPNDCAPDAQVVTASGDFTVQGTTAGGATAKTDGPEHSGQVCQSGSNHFFLDRWYRLSSGPVDLDRDGRLTPEDFARIAKAMDVVIMTPMRPPWSMVDLRSTAGTCFPDSPSVFTPRSGFDIKPGRN